MNYFLPKRLYGMALKKIVVDKELLPKEEFYEVYGNNEMMMSNIKLRGAIEKLEIMHNIKSGGKNPVKYMYSEKEGVS